MQGRLAHLETPKVEYLSICSIPFERNSMDVATDLPSCSWLERVNRIGQLFIVVRQYTSNSARIRELLLQIDQTCTENTVLLGDARIRVQVNVQQLADGSSVRVSGMLTAIDPLVNVSVSIAVRVRDWNENGYVMMPGAVYEGNRFRVVPTWEPQYVKDASPDMEPVISAAVPRLERWGNPGRIQLLTGDMATPAIGIQCHERQIGCLLQTDQGGDFGNHGIFVEEDPQNHRILMLVQAPGVREEVLYNGRASRDHGVDLSEGQRIQLSADLHIFSAPDRNALFEYFWKHRLDRSHSHVQHCIPFSSVFSIQKEKYETQNWVESYGYYSVGMRECPAQDWQTGWVGGLNTTYALLASGDEQMRNRAMRTFDFLCNQKAWHPSGYLRTCFSNGKWYQDADAELQRYNADALYFLIKDFMLLHRRGIQVKPQWEEIARRVADAFCSTWERWKQLGHRIDPQTGDVVWGGTAGAALAPGALALASHYFDDNPRYAQVAKASGSQYYKKYVCRGVLAGAPGDSLHAPDCESAFSLLESYVTLYESTGDHRWIEYARHVAHHAASYVVSYDYLFPPNTTFQRLGMLTRGTMMANAQNKCAVPGICTLSGLPLLKLYRATGEWTYLELLRDIAHAIPQYMSRSDRPIIDRRPNQRWKVMPPGWINERVNMGDWEVRGEPDVEIGVGEIFGGSCWCEAAMMLTWTEIPGVYVNMSHGRVLAFDHVDVVASDQLCDGSFDIVIKNPTPFHARVRVYTESDSDRSRPLGPLAMLDLPVYDIPSGSEIQLKITTSNADWGTYPHKSTVSKLIRL
jgi:hypothetical protein